MNIKFKRLAAVLVSVVSAVSPSAAGALSAYNIEYDGGEPLGTNNVQINANLVNGLTTLMQMDDVDIQASSSNLWKSGYIKDMDSCLPFKYFSVPNTGLNGANKGLGVTISKNQYRAEVTFKKVAVELADTDSEESLFTIGFTEGHSFIYGGWKVFSDATCEQSADGLRRLSHSDGDKIYVDMNLKLYKTGQESAFVTDGLYFGITDIDAAQSYKVLNTGNGLTSRNMYAKSAEDLQNGDSELKNMFVESDNGNYIYSQYNNDGSFTTENIANVYLLLNKETQQNGLDLVFGFAQAAASGVEYYARQLNVTYKSDENGKISGIKKEKVIVGDYPTGSKSTPNDGNEFKHWVADKDVTLKDGTTIKAGKPLKSSEVKNVVVTEDLEFTAIHAGIPPKPEPKTNPATPDTGASTGEINAIQISASIIGIVTCILLAYTVIRVSRRRVNFN